MMQHNALVLVDALHMVNGVTVSARELAAHWGDQSWNLHVYGTGHGQPEHQTQGKATLRKVTHPVRIPLGYYDQFDLAFPVLRTWWHMRNTQPSVIHSMVPGPLGWRGQWYAWRCGIPFAITHFTRFNVYSEMYGGRATQSFVHHVLKTTYSKADLVIAHSPASMKEAYEFGAREVEYVPVGIPVPFKTLDTLLPKREAARERVITRYGLDPDKAIVLYTGRFSIEKSLRSALKAAETLPYNFVFAGDGPLREEVEAHPNTVCAGMQHGQHLHDLYLAADVLISASITETVGRVFLEALAFGTPIVVPDMGQHVSLFPESCPAIFMYHRTETDPGEAAFIEAIRSALSVDDRKTLTGEALDFALHFDWERVIPKHIACYERLIERKRTQKPIRAHIGSLWRTSSN